MRKCVRSFRWPVLVMLVALFLWGGSANRAAAIWTPLAPLNTDAETDSRDDVWPSIATDGNGNWVAVWYGPISMHAARSADNGRTWTDPVTIGEYVSSDYGTVHVATDDAGTWIAVWNTDGSLEGTIGTDQDILLARSTDNGDTWTSPSPLNANAATDSGHDLHPSVAPDSAGNWVAAWQSGDDLGGTIGTDSDILVARSTDSGVTWTDPAALNTDAAIDSESDLTPYIATDGRGNGLVAWSQNGTLVTARSTDNGVTWTDAVSLGITAYAQPVQIPTDSAGNWILVWPSNMAHPAADILMARSTDNGDTWTESMAIHADATHVDSLPQIAMDASGDCVVVWHTVSVAEGDGEGGGIPALQDDVMFVRSTDGCETWTEAELLNTDPDYGFSDVATDGAGNWVVVCSTPTSGPGDSDIFVSRSVFNWNDDPDGDGIRNIEDDDFDNDGIPNPEDDDSDNDGVDDTVELTDGTDLSRPESLRIENTTGGVADTRSGVSVTFPAGCLSSDLILADIDTSVSAPAGSVSNGLVRTGVVFDLQPDGETFGLPVTVTVNYASSDIRGFDETTLTPIWWTGTEYSADGVTLVSLDTDTNTLMFTTTHFTVFALAGDQLFIAEGTPTLSLTGIISLCIILAAGVLIVQSVHRQHIWHT